MQFNSQMGKEQNLNKLAPGCTLVDLLRFDDEDRNSQLSINEFYTAFNKLYSKTRLNSKTRRSITIKSDLFRFRCFGHFFGQGCGSDSSDCECR
jgi:hypothetical protein